MASGSLLPPLRQAVDMDGLSLNSVIDNTHRYSSGAKRIAAGLVCLLACALVVGFATFPSESSAVELEGSSNGAGYISTSSKGLASKALLEQSQEAAEEGKKELEEASSAHLQMDATMAKVKGLLKTLKAQQAHATQEAQGAEKAEEKAAQALLGAKAAQTAEHKHAINAHHALAHAKANARSASELDDESNEEHRKFLEHGRTAGEAQEHVSRLQSSITATLDELTRLKKELVAQKDWQPWTPLHDVEVDNHEEAPASSLSDSYRPVH